MALEIKILDYGDIELESSFLVLGRDCGRTRRVPTLGFLVLGGTWPVLVDTGYRSNQIMETLGMRGLQSYDNMIENQLKKHGLKLGDIRYVLHTHLHIDHAGKDDLFPMSTAVVLNRRELEYSVSGLMHPQYPAVDIKHLIDRLHAKGALRFLDLEISGPTEIMPGLICEAAGGHTEGSMNVIVKTNEGVATICGDVLYDKNSGASAPCASLTKMMTALVFLEQNPDFNRSVEVTNAEILGGGHTQLRRGERVKLGDLLHMSLMCSDNVATRVLARESGLPLEDFLARMNRKAVELGLARTRFVEVTGLDERNVSTAADIARLLHAAADNPTVHDITTQRGYDFLSFTAANRVRTHHISTTNRLLYGRYEIQGGKTGFISESGYCLATWIRTDQRDLIAVVMGAPTNATRFADVVRLVQHTASMSTAPRGL